MECAPRRQTYGGGGFPPALLPGPGDVCLFESGAGFVSALFRQGVDLKIHGLVDFIPAQDGITDLPDCRDLIIFGTRGAI
jgi:hypothetical protein